MNIIYRYIYKITCTQGKYKDYFYFGQHTTKNLNDHYKGSGKKLSDYYKKYPDGYIKEIIAFYNSQDELNKAEYDIIYPWLNNPICLNLCDGGNIGTCSEETKQKIATSNKAKKLSEETKQKISTYQKNKKLSEETKQKIRQSLIGHKVKEESKKKMSETKKKIYIGENNPMYGRHHTEESKKKMSETKNKHFGQKINK